MGTGTSRIGSEPPPVRVSRNNRSRSRARLSSLLVCGCSSSDVRDREKEHFIDVRASSSKEIRPVVEITSERSRGTERLNSNTEAGSLSQISASTSTSRCVSVPHGLVGAEISKGEMYLKNYEELDNPNRISVEIDHGYPTDRRGTIASTSFIEQSSDFVNASVNKEPNDRIENPVNEQGHSSSVWSSRHSLSQEANEAVCSRSSVDLDGFDVVEDASVESNVRPVVSSRGQNGMDERSSHDGPVSTSSYIYSDHLDIRSNSRISSSAASSSTRSAVMSVNPNRDFSSDSGNDALSQNRRPADLNGGPPSGQIGVNNRSEQRQHSRSEVPLVKPISSSLSFNLEKQIWDIVFGINENQRQTNSCPFGVHPGGSCSCDSLLTGEESSIHLSISRIVMLAEALFEVLDEMQPRSAYFSLPLTSHVAPESVVESFPLREYMKPKTAESTDDVQQCYICLSEYEDGDKIRLLPCHHEYHMACVDKWLKEIHGVCPLCRGDVAGGVSVNEGSDSMNPSS
ncbi:PREDICTED: uncharacterized RING finger protein C4G3.12c-like isoform X2 [Tarenaya hassleriana]|uniref:uncharacterized RING finger protein C4G3.12c-like isoform X2 n=1 Tax=Tarenaya hassleriana TaxID=28532 RepID=UPI00053C96B9|nr:PREDICTED: uncharacterized RING finger protein C4G3.12c-like isoform X2 [Tarenaya hassleriana]